MQNKEEEWGQRFEREFPKGYKNKPEWRYSDTKDCFALFRVEKLDIGWRTHSARKELKSFISQKIEKAYEKGKEETLEEVEKMVENIDTGFETSFNYGYRKMKDEILQQLNKLKENSGGAGNLYKNTLGGKGGIA